MNEFLSTSCILLLNPLEPVDFSSRSISLGFPASLISKSLKLIPGCDNANLFTTSRMEIPSALSDFKNFNRAGIDLKRFFISIRVPSRYCAGLICFNSPYLLEISKLSLASIN